MGITSFYFLCFYAVLLLLYYVIPGKLQWMLLLGASILYYILYYVCDGGQPLLILYPLISVLITYLSTRFMESAKGQNQICRKWAMILGILGNVGILFALKYVNFLINTVNGIAKAFQGDTGLDLVHFLVPLGISYYSMTLIGYIVDVYFGTTRCNRNLSQIALYGMYFPVFISGPILTYKETGEQFFEAHPLDYHKVTKGLQRMLWGFFEKIVIAQRLGLVVDTVYGDYENYPGFYIVLATVCFAFQLYTDFSGCMDIVLGISETFGLTLPENFDRPFLSGTVAEYWRKWHMTLGVWMRNYVFYPILRSKAFTKLNQKLRDRFGKKKGKQLNTFAAMFLLWFTVGVWHGGDWKYVIGSGLLHWLYIVLEELWAPGFQKLLDKCHIDSKGKGIAVFRVIRTFFLVNIGFVFFRGASVGAACKMLVLGITTFNPSIFWNGGILGLGLDWIEWVIVLVSLAIMITVSVLGGKLDVRDRIAEMKLPARWAIYFALLFYVILLGQYGPGYSAAEFIYQGF